MGIWIAIAIVLFVLGSVMALKPSAIDVRLDRLRMTARRLQLNPKLVACPDWLRGRDDELGKGMMGQYALILEDTKLPETYYHVIEGQLRPYLGSQTTPKANSEPDVNDVNPVLGSGATNYTLDRESLKLPESIEPFVKGVYSKANSMVVFWQDSSYVKPSTNPNYNSNAIEPDLLMLKSRMQDWANKLSF